MYYTDAQYISHHYVHEIICLKKFFQDQNAERRACKMEIRKGIFIIEQEVRETVKWASANRKLLVLT